MSHVLDQIIDGLKQSPLFQLSLASKELFHSNFLAWLCVTYPDHAGRLFAAFLNYTPPTCQGLRAQREWHNIDLLLNYPGGGVLVIENKVKSLPVRDQLDEYAAAVPDKEKTSFLLLSLSRPAFLPLNEATIQVSDGMVWQYLSYRDLADKLLEVLPHIAAIDSYHGRLLDDYIHFITHLDVLGERFVVDWDDEQGDFFDVRSEVHRLKDIRVHDLVDKIRYAQLERRVGDVLRDEGFPAVLHEKLCDGHEGPAGSILLGTDMTRGVGLFNLEYIVMDKHRLGNPVILGIQVQGNQFRLVVELTGEHKDRAIEIAKALRQHGGSNKLWFDFGRLPDGSGEYPQNGEFNQYSGVFFYRSKRLGNISPKRLVDTIVAYTRSIQANQVSIQRRIEAVLQESNV